MFGILVSAFNVALGFVLRTVVVKFILFFGLYFVVQAFCSGSGVIAAKVC
ncbi:hypothetical protein GF111_26525 [Serratia sp. HRI]|nr:hypothetical protein [Serratia sp. HRI]UBI64305.1 hypothetical protein GF111_26525 [Serratia sp. HRI]